MYARPGASFVLHENCAILRGIPINYAIICVILAPMNFILFRGSGVCFLKRVVGPCKGNYMEWFYDAPSRSCKYVQSID